MSEWSVCASVSLSARVSCRSSQSYDISAGGEHGTSGRLVATTAAAEQLTQLETKTLPGDDVDEEVVGVDGLHDGPRDQVAAHQLAGGRAVVDVEHPQIGDAQHAVRSAQQHVDERRAELGHSKFTAPDTTRLDDRVRSRRTGGVNLLDSTNRVIFVEKLFLATIIIIIIINMDGHV